MGKIEEMLTLMVRQLESGQSLDARDTWTGIRDDIPLSKHKQSLISLMAKDRIDTRLAIGSINYLCVWQQGYEQARRSSALPVKVALKQLLESDSSGLDSASVEEAEDVIAATLSSQGSDPDLWLLVWLAWDWTADLCEWVGLEYEPDDELEVVGEE